MWTSSFWSGSIQNSSYVDACVFHWCISERKLKELLKKNIPWYICSTLIYRYSQTREINNWFIKNLHSNTLLVTNCSIKSKRLLFWSDQSQNSKAFDEVQFIDSITSTSWFSINQFRRKLYLRISQQRTTPFISFTVSSFRYNSLVSNSYSNAEGAGEGGSPETQYGGLQTCSYSWCRRQLTLSIYFSVVTNKTEQQKRGNVWRSVGI